MHRFTVSIGEQSKQSKKAFMCGGDLVTTGKDKIN